MNIMKLAQTEDMIAIPNEMIFEYLLTSVVLGVFLMILAVWTSRKISEQFSGLQGALKTKGVDSPQGEIGEILPLSYPELILGSANVLFLCFGMTGIMILVNNNLARAFAIGAAIAVVRFRIKFDSHGLGSTLFFGVLVGMACGVGQILTATVITAAYGILQMIIILLMNVTQKKEATKLPSL
jgi:hypothetical protein